MCIVVSHTPPKPEAFKSLRDMTGWGEISLEQADSAITGSLHFICLQKKSNLIGMARLVGDGALNLYIQDVVIHPDYRGQGYGKRLIAALLDIAQDTYSSAITVGLMAAEGQEGIYKSLGFQSRPCNGFGAGMSATLGALAKTESKA